MVDVKCVHTNGFISVHFMVIKASQMQKLLTLQQINAHLQNPLTAFIFIQRNKSTGYQMVNMSDSITLNLDIMALSSRRLITWVHWASNRTLTGKIHKGEQETFKNGVFSRKDF